VIVCPGGTSFMTAPVFVDSNVLVYRFDLSEPEKQRRAERWLNDLWERKAGRLSTQVLQEAYVTLTRKLARPMAPSEARDALGALLSWEPLSVDGPIIEEAWRIEDRFRLSFWDALIVSAAKAGDCRYLLTEDLSHDQDLENLRVISPFRVEPQALTLRP